jgi:hypothetical protein
MSRTSLENTTSRATPWYTPHSWTLEAKAMVKPKSIDKAFLRFLSSKQVDYQVSPDAAFRAMLAFYREERASGCNVENDADMLLFQWGVFDWGNGEHLDIDITRQVIIPGKEDDDAIWQLHLTYRCKPNTSDRNLGSGEEWCSSPDELEEFAQLVTDSGAFSCLKPKRSDAVVEIHFENAG